MADVLILALGAVIVMAGSLVLALTVRRGRRGKAELRHDAPRRLRDDLRATDAYIEQRAQQDAAAREAERQMTLMPAREPEPCPSLPAYRRHKARGEDTEACGCGEAARAAWRERKRETARGAGPRLEAGQEQQRGSEAA